MGGREWIRPLSRADPIGAKTAKKLEKSEKPQRSGLDPGP